MFQMNRQMMMPGPNTQMGAGGHMPGPMDSQYPASSLQTLSIPVLFRLRAQQCRMEGNMEAAQKLETMLGVLEGRRVVSLEYLLNLENWIHKKADFLVCVCFSVEDKPMDAPKGQQVPALRLVIPLSYPAASVTVDRAAIDLDAFFYDDLQNVVHERLARPGLHSVTEFLNTWVSSSSPRAPLAAIYSSFLCEYIVCQYG
ncbi:unnamed protein product [Heligmosomoides polygyrus]|uniref:ARC105/Med15 mediator subunit C-terminal domain-containing protein n=1 Tax=Heligmosomoides polygyrus TaxID=6339 RepID=A0A3P8BWZ3_HELPZ|nr:unnamed protein product [Heligmosomoides polygyrus]